MLPCRDRGGTLWVDSPALKALCEGLALPSVRPAAGRGPLRRASPETIRSPKLHHQFRCQERPAADQLHGAAFITRWLHRGVKPTSPTTPSDRQSPRTLAVRWQPDYAAAASRTDEVLCAESNQNYDREGSHGRWLPAMGCYKFDSIFRWLYFLAVPLSSSSTGCGLGSQHAWWYFGRYPCIPATENFGQSELTDINRPAD